VEHPPTSPSYSNWGGPQWPSVKRWKVFCRLRAGEDEATAVVAKQVAARARQQRWRETEQQRLGLRATKQAGHGPFQQTRWHVLGQCQHPDLKDARRKAALELQSKTHSTFTRKIKDLRGRLPYWRQPFAITADDELVWPDDEPGINAKSGWQISHWWGLWGPNRMDKWATDHQDQGNPLSAREWAVLLRALTATAGLERTRPVPLSMEGFLPTPSRNRR
jgi:hypothetical protein